MLTIRKAKYLFLLMIIQLIVLKKFGPTKQKVNVVYIGNKYHLL